MPIYEVIFLKPKNDAIEAFEKAVKEHNSKYYNKTEGVSAYLRSIVSGKKAGQTAKELPMYVDVSISFKPIHNFVPKIQQNDYEGLAIPGGGKYISTFGKERYIALKNALNNQYDSFNFAPPAAGEEQKRNERVTGSGASASIGVNVGNAVNSLNDQIETFGNIGSNPGY